MSDLNTQLLINMGVQLAELQKGMGSVSAQLAAGSEKHKRFEEALDILDHRTDIIENKVIDTVAILKPEEGPSLVQRVKALEDFNGKIGAIISVGAMVLWGVAYFIWNTLTWVYTHWSDIRNGIKSFFH